jgi:hypothetical protein
MLTVCGGGSSPADALPPPVPMSGMDRKTRRDTVETLNDNRKSMPTRLFFILFILELDPE